ncbi:MAG: multidrug efflux SMR transporter [Bacteroidetes bacterium]|nr:multidrug efflux SMR transporter [Bacteroidota bacterium]
MYYIYLILAIAFEVLGTTSLKACNGFTKFWPSVLVVVGYALTLFFFSLCIRQINLGVAYAIWAGVGIVLVVFSNLIIFKQTIDLPAIIGVILILAGVIVINIFSKTVLE